MNRRKEIAMKPAVTIAQVKMKRERQHDVQAFYLRARGLDNERETKGSPLIR
ncbi:MAG: hypothetical protein HKP25_06300 [Marinicaulis sp.]|nr:hypothetical protein [Marinicaulis sp.]